MRSLQDFGAAVSPGTGGAWGLDPACCRCSHVPAVFAALSMGAAHEHWATSLPLCVILVVALDLRLGPLPPPPPSGFFAAASTWLCLPVALPRLPLRT